MAYTNNVPQGNQQIATTQPLIQSNFGFLNTGIGQEHNFDATGSGTNMWHLKASMPSSALSPALPGGIGAGAGVFFVNNSIPYFYEGITNYQLNPFEKTISGTWLATLGFTTIAAIPANKQGFIILTVFNDMTPAGLTQMGCFVTSGSNCYAFATGMKTNSSSTITCFIDFNNAVTSLNLQGKATAVGSVGTYNYKIFVRPS